MKRTCCKPAYCLCLDAVEIKDWLSVLAQPCLCTHTLPRIPARTHTHRYVLDDNMYGKQALDTIVELVFNKPGEDIAVIMAGYEAPIMKMIRCVLGRAIVCVGNSVASTLSRSPHNVRRTERRAQH